MKNKKYGYLALIVAIIAFNVIAFVVPLGRNTTFWVAYVFTDIAFVAQIAIWSIAFKSSESLKSKFLGIPIANVGLIYLVVQIAAFAILVGIRGIPSWIVIVVCVVILAISCLCFIVGDLSKNIIRATEANVQTKVSFVKKIQSDMEILASEEMNPEIKNALNQLAEDIRYSDPMSDESLRTLEVEIEEKIAKFREFAEKENSIREIRLLIAERNNKVKLLK